MRHFLVNIFSASLIAILLIATHFSVASAVAGVPTVISYQGRLTDANGILLGGTSGTNYYFKFSIWDSATVGGGTRLWPASAPGTISLPVTEGVFNVNIGDTGTGYPDALTYNFQDNDTVYLQVEVSTNGSSFETPGPRQRITSSGTAINAKTLGGNLPSYFLDANNLTNFQTPFNTALAGVTADAVAEGTLNKYFTSTLFDSSFAAKTTDNLTEGATNKYFTASNFNTSFATKSTTDLTEGSNLYYTDVRARAALSATGPITYDNITGVIGIGTATSTTDGALTATDWNTFNGKQNAITTGTTAQYLRGDLSLGTFPTALSAFTNDQGFLTSVSNGDVLAAIGYTPYDASNPAGYITASSADSLTNKTGDISQWTNDTGYLTSASLSGYVPTTRTLTINGVGYDLTTDQSWTVGDVSTGGSYSDPSWITSLDWSKIASLPSTLSGYGITDAVPDTRTINGYALSSDITLTKSDLSLGNVEDTALSTWAGTTNITTLGTIATGVWQGTAIADGYIASASTWNAKEDALTFSTGLTRTSNTITNDLSTGVSGGQTVYGGTGSGDNLVLRSTTNATRGNVKIDTTSGGFNFRDYLGSIPAIYPGSNVTAGSDNFILASFGSTSMFYGAGGASSLYMYVGAGNRTRLTSTYYGIGVNTIVGDINTTPTSKLEVQTNTLGTTQTTSSGLALTNTTAAALAAQQISPALRWSGKGWGTTASTSQAADFRAYVLPVQGAAQPSGELLFESAFGSSSYQRAFSVGDPTAAAGGISASVYGNGTQGQMRIYAGQASSFNQLGISVTVGTSTLDGASNAVALSTNSTQRLTVFPTTGFVGIGTAAFTPTSKVEVRTNALGVTQTTDSGLALTNTTAAALAAQQISPALRFSGNGWKTAATAASQAVDFRNYLTPAQGVNNPTGILKWDYSVNGGAYADVFTITPSSGRVTVLNGIYAMSLVGGATGSIATEGSQNINISPNNTAVLTAALGGNVGIGQTVPTSKLDVTTNSLGTTQTTSSGLALVNTTAAAAGAQQISPALRWSGQGWKTDATAASQSVDFRSYVVPVQGAANPSGYLTFENSVNGGTYTSGLQLYTSTGNNQVRVYGNSNVAGSNLLTSASLLVGSNGFAGVVGITGHSNGGASIQTAQNGGTSIGGYLLLQQLGGVVGIGGAATYKLDVLNSATAQTADTRVANFYNTGATFNTTAGALNSYGGYFASTSTRSAGSNALTNIGLYATASGAQNNYAAIFQNGNVGISNTTPGYLLHVGSSSTVSGTTVARFENAGGTCDITPDLVSGVVCTSDERFKENISSYEGSLDQVLALRPVSYSLIKDTSHESQIGFLAQELEQVLPGLVRTDAQGNKAVLYAGLTPILVGAVKDMDIRVKALELGTITNGLGEYASLFFTDVMEKVEDGIAYVRSMVVGTLKVGTPEKRTGITLYDEETGDPYCLSIANGQTKTIEGECGIYEPEPEIIEPDPQPEVPSDTPSDTGPAPETTPTPEENPPVIEEPSVPEETPTPSPEPETPPEPDVQPDPQPEAPVTP